LQCLICSLFLPFSDCFLDTETCYFGGLDRGKGLLVITLGESDEFIHRSEDLSKYQLLSSCPSVLCAKDMAYLDLLVEALLGAVALGPKVACVSNQILGDPAVFWVHLVICQESIRDGVDSDPLTVFC